MSTSGCERGGEGETDVRTRTEGRRDGGGDGQQQRAAVAGGGIGQIKNNGEREREADDARAKIFTCFLSKPTHPT